MESDDSLNFRSLHFNPRKVLSIEGIKPPYPRMKALDNISKCRILLPKSHPDYIRYKKKDQTPTSSSESKDNKTENEKKDPENPTLGSQEEKIQNESTEKNIETRKRAREEEGFLSKLAESLISGPFSLLRNCFQHSHRIRVWIRRHVEIRGICIGTLIAFDRHMNIVLKDVEEIYKTYEWRETNQDSSPKETKEDIELDLQDRSTCFKKDVARKVRICIKKTRRVAQLFIRGDNVVIICRDAQNTSVQLF